MKALIVDDSMTMRKIIARALQEIGFQESDLAQAGDGTEGVSAAINEDFDLILMDWNMPKMSGFDALKKIREKGITTPVIMVTTEGEKTRVVNAIQAGANNYVVKPFENDALNEKVKAVLGMS